MSCYPPYSPEPAPSDYHLFPGLNTQLKDRYFSSDAEVIAAADILSDVQLFDFFFEWLTKVEAMG